MSEPLPSLFVPGLNCSARLFADQTAALWRFGPVTVADHTRDDSMAAIVGRILADAPLRFALIGLSMGGYVCFEILRQAPGRVARLALLDTSARADRPEQMARRDELIELARTDFAKVNDALWPVLVHRDRREDKDLRALVDLMGEETGPDAFIRQQTALKARPDSRPDLAAIGCPTLVLVGDGDELTPPKVAQEMVQAIEGATLAIVPDCGHLSTLEKPELVSAALAKWMDER
jgi:pimeloyl-ACP methyl ester carboxylesterase